jgi:hypothetical protein
MTCLFTYQVIDVHLLYVQASVLFIYILQDRSGRMMFYSHRFARVRPKGRIKRS